jgi:hypothetical protein
MKSHTIISGTGRTGTTLLVQLFTRLGLDTGFRDKKMIIDPIAKSGLEHHSFTPETPYIIKSPWLCDYLENVVTTVTIDHAIIPIRDLKSVVASRIRVQQAHGAGKKQRLCREASCTRPILKNRKNYYLRNF